LGLPSVEGVYISSVTPGGGADDAGIRSDDVIVGINDIKIKSIPELQEQVGRLHPGTKIEVEYIRKGKRYRTSVTLKNKNQTTRFTNRKVAGDVLERHGFDLRELTADERRKLRVSGVYVENIALGSVIEKTEMDPGYIITKVGEVRVSSVEEVVNELKKRKGKEVYLEGFYENYPGEYYYTFEVQ
jgi:S1-C subfamily serine protease